MVFALDVEAREPPPAAEVLAGFVEVTELDDADGFECGGGSGAALEELPPTAFGLELLLLCGFIDECWWLVLAGLLLDDVESDGGLPPAAADDDDGVCDELLAGLLVRVLELVVPLVLVRCAAAEPAAFELDPDLMGAEAAAARSGGPSAGPRGCGWSSLSFFLILYLL